MLNNFKNNTYKKIVLGILILVFCGGVLMASQVLAAENGWTGSVKIHHKPTCECSEGDIRLQIGVPIPSLIKTKKCSDEKTIYCVKDFPTYIKAFYKLFISVIGILAVIMIMVGGFQWLMAAGNAQKIGGAKTIIISAIMGLVLTLTSYTILNILNPDVLNLKLDPKIVKLDEPSTNTFCNQTMTPLDEGTMVESNWMYDVPRCGKKYLYNKETAPKIEVAYCAGFSCGDAGSIGTSVCFKYNSTYSCEESIKINDEENGYGDRLWYAKGHDWMFENNIKCGDLYYQQKSTSISSFAFGVYCPTGKHDVDEYCYIGENPSANFLSSKSPFKKNQEAGVVGKIKGAKCMTDNGF